MSGETSGEQSSPLSEDCAKLVLGALRKIRAELDLEIQVEEIRPPQITDTRQQIMESALNSSRLAGERTMLERIAEALGLTELG